MLQSIVCAAILFCILHLPSNGQSEEFKKEIDAYFNAILSNTGYNLSSTAIKGADSKYILNLANRHIINTNSLVRYKIIDLIKRKALTEEDIHFRKLSVHFLLEAIKDKDSGNSGTATKSLTRFALEDFDTQAKDTLYHLLLLKPYHYEDVVKLAGFVNPKKCLQLFQDNLANDSLLKPKDKWVIRLALARMGDTAAAKYCLDKIKSQPLNDNVVTWLFPDLVYTRQPEAIQYLLGQILTDAKVCNSPSPETDEKTICAFKIMELVAPVITNFPLPADKYGDLDIGNYNEALLTVRNWIASKPEIKVLCDTY
jgi:hypothetical protein